MNQQRRLQSNGLAHSYVRGLTPLEPLDLNRVQDFDELLQAMGKTAFGGRTLGEAADVLEEMVQAPDCTIIGTFSGAMSVAKMGLLICEMIDRGWLQMVITTGALVAHGLIENLGQVHYKCPKNHSDRQLYQEGYNRIYDTLEMEKNLDYAEEVVRGVLDRLDASEALSSESLCKELGRYLAEHTDKPGLLRNAYLKGVPVFIPAFTDGHAHAGDPAKDLGMLAAFAPKADHRHANIAVRTLNTPGWQPQPKANRSCRFKKAPSAESRFRLLVTQTAWPAVSWTVSPLCYLIRFSHIISCGLRWVRVRVRNRVDPFRS